MHHKTHEKRGDRREPLLYLLFMSVFLTENSKQTKKMDKRRNYQGMMRAGPDAAASQNTALSGSAAIMTDTP